MNHLKRLMYSALAGLIAAIVVVVLAGQRHKALAVHAAAAHETASHLTSIAAISFGVVVTFAVFIPWDIAVARRRDRMKRAIQMGGGYQGGGW